MTIMHFNIVLFGVFAIATARLQSTVSSLTSRDRGGSPGLGAAPGSADLEVGTLAAVHPGMMCSMTFGGPAALTWRHSGVVLNSFYLSSTPEANSNGDQDDSDCVNYDAKGSSCPQVGTPTVGNYDARRPSGLKPYNGDPWMGQNCKKHCAIGADAIDQIEAVGNGIKMIRRFKYKDAERNDPKAKINFVGYTGGGFEDPLKDEVNSFAAELGFFWSHQHKPYSDKSRLISAALRSTEKNKEDTWQHAVPLVTAAVHFEALSLLAGEAQDKDAAEPIMLELNQHLAKAWPKNTGNEEKDRQFFCSELAVAVVQAAIAVVRGKAAITDTNIIDCKPVLADPFECAKMILKDSTFIAAAQTALYQALPVRASACLPKQVVDIGTDYPQYFETVLVEGWGAENTGQTSILSSVSAASRSVSF